MLRRYAFCLLIILLAATAHGADPQTGSKWSITAVDHQRSTIYHSPQTPGFTCWVGAWMMPDDSIMVCFTQATGPIEGRPGGPKEVLKKLSWPPAGHPLYDMTGLDMRNVHLRSFDGGKTWKQVSADPFRSCMNGCTGQPETALSDGTVIRGVWGHYLPYDPELPKTGYLQRSGDGTKTWGPPEVLMDPKRYLVWPARIRVLRDGRLIVIGGISYTRGGDPAPPGSLTRGQCINKPFLVVSEDHGKTWSPPLDVVPSEHRENWSLGVEYDAAELPDGDLLCVFRRGDLRKPGQFRWQGRLRKNGKTWVPEQFGPAPFPHSGHPDLLLTREGVILHVATSGIHWTRDAGRSWHRLDIPGTHYYPRSVQTPDGSICIFAHVGSDNAYGSVDQSITMDTFRLRVSEAAR